MSSSKSRKDCGCDKKSSKKHSKKSKECKSCITPCTKEDYKQAVAVSDEVDRNINLTNEDPVGSARRFADLHASNGVFSIAVSDAIGYYLRIGNTYGPENIYQFFVGYTTNPGESEITVALKKAYWDCVRRTLFVERRWDATVEVPRTFVYGPPGQTGPLATLTQGEPYTQDDAILYQFDCKYKLTTNHEYFDQSQYRSTFVEYKPKCHPNEGSKAKKCNLPPKCTDCDRDKATEIWQKLFLAINLLSYDLNLGVELISELFAKDGIYSTTTPIYPFPNLPGQQYNFVGPKQIAAHLTDYYTNGLGSLDSQRNIETREIYWDCHKRTLGVEFNWVATLGSPRTFWNQSPPLPPALVLEAGAEYSQDNLAVITLNSDFKIVYYRAYFAQNQWRSSYRKYAAPVCTVNCDCKSCEKCTDKPKREHEEKEKSEKSEH